MSELLLELCSGEIPAMMQDKAAKAYKDIFTKYFIDNAIKFEQINVYVGPRRLTIFATGVATKLEASVKELKGPKVSAPKAAIDGFCRVNNITADALERVEIKGVESYIYREKTSEQNVGDILLASLHRPIAEYVWPKSMYWGKYKIKWIRPLDNIMCVFDGKTIAFEYGHIIANNQTYGHRFMAPEARSVSNFAEYKKALEDNFVVLDAADRKKYIEDRLEEETKKLGLVIKEDPFLLEEVVGLTEYPQILVGKIDEKFLSVPSEILVNAMRSHQKYFSLFDRDGKFAPYFIFVSNIASTDIGTVISGNEKVLSARLADALYFYNQDLKTSLQDKADHLGKVIFHAKLGSIKEKTLRLAEVVKFIDPHNASAASAALLCKSDIVSEVVDEFPTLQGIMGYYYAKEESLNDEIAVAIRDHYKPNGPQDNCPTGSAAILALADKMDNLCGLMLAGEKPSGSKDPFALRRQAIGIIRIILENKLSIDLSSLVAFVSNEYKNKIDVSDGLKKQIIGFLEERLKYFFKDQYKVNMISSVLDLDIEPNLIETQSKLQAVNSFLSSPEGDDLLVSYKRASNILGTTKLKGEIDESALISEHEIELFAVINNCDAKIDQSLVAKDYTEALRVLTSMHVALSKFFDNVMVKDKDAIIANNRMILLYTIRQIFNKIANFDKL